jgi:homing endonuclease-like protein
VHRLLAGEQASHLCHQPTCIDPDRVIIKPKENEMRKGCRAQEPIILTEINGREYIGLCPRVHALAKAQNVYIWWRGE